MLTTYSQARCSSCCQTNSATASKHWRNELLMCTQLTMMTSEIAVCQSAKSPLVSCNSNASRGSWKPGTLKECIAACWLKQPLFNILIVYCCLITTSNG